MTSGELQMYAGIVLLVIVSAIVLYIMDRRSKSAPFVWTDAAKLGAGAGTLAGGILYSVTSPDSPAASVVEQVQEMFVGKPEF